MTRVLILHPAILKEDIPLNSATFTLQSRTHKIFPARIDTPPSWRDVSFRMSYKSNFWGTTNRINLSILKDRVQPRKMGVLALKMSYMIKKNLVHNQKPSCHFERGHLFTSCILTQEPTFASQNRTHKSFPARVDTPPYSGFPSKIPIALTPLT